MILAPVNQSDMVLLPDALNDLKQTCRACEIEIPTATPLNLDPGFDSRKNRKAVWNAGLIPNIKENPRKRKKPKRGRKRFFDPQVYEMRFVCERSFAWADKFRRILVRYEWYEHLYHAFHILAFALINFRCLQY
jgi:transposase